MILRPRAHAPHASDRTAGRRAGFTLLETMVALAILGSGVAAVLGLLATGLSVTHRSHTRVLLTELAEERLQRALLDERAGGEAEGRLDPPHQAIRWRTRVARGAVPGTRVVEAMVIGEGDSVHLATVRFR